MNKIVATFRRLLSNTTGNGEIVAVLVAVGIAVTLGFAAVKTIGTGSSQQATKQASAITALPAAAQ